MKSCFVVIALSRDRHDKFLQSDKIMPSRLLLAQQARKHALDAEQECYEPSSKKE